MLMVNYSTFLPDFKPVIDVAHIPYVGRHSCKVYGILVKSSSLVMTLREAYCCP